MTVKRIGALLLICAGAVAASAGARQVDGKKTFELTAKKFSFIPDRIEVTQGDVVVLTTKSADSTHGLEIRKFKVKKAVPKGGAPVTVEFVASEAGTFPITCSEFCGSGHKQMKATLVVAPKPTH